MHRALRQLLPLLVLSLMLAACDDAFDVEGESGTMSLLLTDEPGDFEHAIVTIDRIELLGDAGTILLRDDPVTVDLLDLQNQLMVLVDETPVPGGRYSEVRLVITDGLIEVEQHDGTMIVYASSNEFARDEGFDDADGQLHMPSFGASGLKIKLPAGEAIVDGDDNAVLIDFNVAESFGHQAGNSGRWILHPVIHATGFSQTGSIILDIVLDDGVTLPVIEGTQTTLGMIAGLLDRDGDVIEAEFTDTDEDGTFQATFRFVPPGDWTVDLGLPAGLLLTTDPAFPYTFTVSPAQAVSQTFTVTAAETE